MGRSVVLVSGGLNSAVALAWAKHVFQEVHALTFDDGSNSLDAAKKVAESIGVESHVVVKLGFSLIANGSFTPGKSSLYLSAGANRAVALNANSLTIGLVTDGHQNQWDHYPAFVSETAWALNLALSGQPHKMSVDAPLLNMSKDEVAQYAKTLPKCLEALNAAGISFDNQPANSPKPQLDTVKKADTERPALKKPEVEQKQEQK